LFKGAYSFEPVSQHDCEFCLKSPVKRPNHGSIWFAGEALHDLYGGYLQAAFLSGKEQALEISKTYSSKIPAKKPKRI
jgi:monoamine oxidase